MCPSGRGLPGVSKKYPPGSRRPRRSAIPCIAIQSSITIVAKAFTRGLGASVDDCFSYFSLLTAGQLKTTGAKSRLKNQLITSVEVLVLHQHNFNQIPFRRCR